MPGADAGPVGAGAALAHRLAFLKQPAEIHVTETLTGFDLAFRSAAETSTPR